MPEVWFTLKKSIGCTKSLLCDVHEPKATGDSIANETTEGESYGCLRSKSNLRDVICGSKRHSEKPPVGSSSRSTASSEILNPMIHGHEAQIITSDISVSDEVKFRLKADSNYMEFDTLPSPVGETFISNFAPRKVHTNSATSDVTELVEGEWSRRVIELICERSWLKSTDESCHIEKIFKVHNSPKILSWFEQHREIIKIKESKLQSKNPRCLVDGNELLGFHGTKVACSLATHGSPILCRLQSCGVCQILRHGFTQNQGNDGKGVLTYATSGRAFESTALKEEERGLIRALMVCRVIAGRIYSGAPEEEEVKADSGLAFDSLGVKMGHYSKFEALRVLNPRAVLACFAVTFKHQ